MRRRKDALYRRKAAARRHRHWARNGFLPCMIVQYGWAAGPLMLTCVRCGKEQMKYAMRWQVNGGIITGPFCCSDKAVAEKGRVMNSDEINKATAKLVMGWPDGMSPMVYCNEAGEWNPVFDVNQAMMVLHMCALHGAPVEIRADLHMAEVSMGDRIFSAIISCDPEDGIPELPRAICEAALDWAKSKRPKP